VAATDALTMAAVTLAVLAVARLACWLPGLRAARIHPLEARGD
jgi:ABC-type lipoprotein release transport system permease subunit